MKTAAIVLLAFTLTACVSHHGTDCAHNAIVYLEAEPSVLALPYGMVYEPRNDRALSDTRVHIDRRLKRLFQVHRVLSVTHAFTNPETDWAFMAYWFRVELPSASGVDPFIAEIINSNLGYAEPQYCIGFD